MTVLTDLLLCPIGKPKEAQARSCHQEVARQAKAALAGGSIGTSAGPLTAAMLLEPTASEDSGAALTASNGYLAAAELCLLLKLPALASQLLDLATSKGQLLCTWASLALCSKACMERTFGTSAPRHDTAGKGCCLLVLQASRILLKR